MALAVATVLTAGALAGCSVPGTNEPLTRQVRPLPRPPQRCSAPT